MRAPCLTYPHSLHQPHACTQNVTTNMSTVCTTASYSCHMCSTQHTYVSCRRLEHDSTQNASGGGEALCSWRHYTMLVKRISVVWEAAQCQQRSLTAGSCNCWLELKTHSYMHNRPVLSAENGITTQHCTQEQHNIASHARSHTSVLLHKYVQ